MGERGGKRGESFNKRLMMDWMHGWSWTTSSCWHHTLGMEQLACWVPNARVARYTSTLQFLCKRYYCWLLELSRFGALRTVKASCSSGCWAEQSCPGAARCSEMLISGEQLSLQACWRRTRGWWQSTPRRPGSGERLVGRATGGSQLLKLSQLASPAGREAVGAAKDMTFLMLIRKGGSIHNSLIYVFMLHVSLI